MSNRNIFLIAWAACAVFVKLTGETALFALVVGLIPAILCAAVVGVVRGLRGSKTQPRARGGQPLTVTEGQDGWTVIDAHPEPLPAMFGIVPIIVGLMAAIAVMNLGGPWRSLAGMLFTAGAAWVVVGGLISVWVRALQNGRRSIQQAPFAVHRDAVRLPDGTDVASSRIYAVTLRNALDGSFTFLVNNSTIGAMSSMSAAHAAAKLAKVAYRIDLDHDGRSTTLAGGLTEPQARAVASEVIRRVATLQ